MKKLIFLLIMAVFLASFMPALETARPPGAAALDIALPGYSAESRVIIPDTVLDLLLNGEWPAGISVFAGTVLPNFIGQSQGYYLIKPIDTGQGAAAVYLQPGYWLRL